MNNAELIKTLRYCGKNVGCSKCPIYDEPRQACFQILTSAADALESAEKRIAELEAQLPNEGEWIHGKELSRAYVGNCCVGIIYENFRCSACGAVIEEYEKPKWKYCPNCGARMKGEQK